MTEIRQRQHSSTSRYTDDEWRTVEQTAKLLGLSVGQYQRAAALSGVSLPLPRVRRRPTPELSELRKLFGQLGRIGGLLNQIAAAVNSGRDVASAEIHAALDDVREIRALVREAMGGPPRDVHDEQNDEQINLARSLDELDKLDIDSLRRVRDRLHRRR